jgi:D-sedoheptulose 7-phosphate isomerase
MNNMSGTWTLEALRDSVLRKSAESREVKERFFAGHAEKVVSCAEAMAERFAAGGRLFVFGNGGSYCDAQHLSVEFMHPIHEKRKALPALAVMSEAPLLTAIGNDQDFSIAFASQLQMLGKKGDIALAISTSGKSASLVRALQAAREMGLLTIGFSGKDGGRFPALCDHSFVVPSFSIHRIQESHVTLLHLLWDTVHLVRGEEDIL